MGDTQAYPKLTAHIPTGALISLPVISSVLSSFAIQLGFQIFSFIFVKQFPFYKPPHINPEDPSGAGANQSFENTAVFWVSSFQYLGTVVAFSVSRPFRRPLYTNKIFIVSLILMLAFNIYLVATPH
jgi:cation-transporting ATPase 13A3/4/5